MEQQYVHNVYNMIADEFDDSRFSVWNFVKDFLKDKESQYGLDIGCGNGKNMIHNNMIGIDTCPIFVNKCIERGKTCMLANCTELPFHTGEFDYAMAISVIHHLSTHKRRVEAINEMRRVVKIGGELIFNIWSVENQTKRKFVNGDNFVPWETRPKKNVVPKVYSRYYYICNELSFIKLIEEFNFKQYEIYNECGNWIVKIINE